MRLIKEESLLKMYKNDEKNFRDSGEEFQANILAAVIMDIENAEKIEITKCKDCIHYFDGVCLKIYSDGNVSSDAWQKRKPEDYCSYGEMKEHMEKRHMQKIESDGK